MRAYDNFSWCTTLPIYFSYMLEVKDKSKISLIPSLNPCLTFYLLFSFCTYHLKCTFPDSYSKKYLSHSSWFFMTHLEFSCRKSLPFLLMIFRLLLTKSSLNICPQSLIINLLVAFPSFEPHLYIFLTIFFPFITSPNTTWNPSNQGHALDVI
jgi:hypothetical protein